MGRIDIKRQLHSWDFGGLFVKGRKSEQEEDERGVDKGTEEIELEG